MIFASRGNQLVEGVVVLGFAGGGDTKCAAVKVNEKREFLGGGFESRTVEPGGDTGLRGNNDVLGGDTGFRIKGCRDNLKTNEPIDGTIFVHLDPRWYIMDYFSFDCSHVTGI